MALCRCKDHHSPPKSPKYIAYAYPVGYPDTSTICGRKACQDVAVVWLDDIEYASYQNGQRIFGGPSNMTKMKVDGRGAIGIDQLVGRQDGGAR
jgi:hypothetical protein